MTDQVPHFIQTRFNEEVFFFFSVFCMYLKYSDLQAFKIRVCYLCSLFFHICYETSLDGICIEGKF